MLRSLALAALVLALAPAAKAEGLGDLFGALPKAERVAMQRELARADFYLAEADGRWSPSTERALRRSVDALALKTGDRLHPRLNDSAEAQRYMQALSNGTFSRLLYGGNLIERIFFLSDEESELDWQG